jgi:excisionase family DNA binding protein
MSSATIQNPFEIIIDQLSRIEALLIELKIQDLIHLPNLSQEVKEDKDKKGVQLAMRITGYERSTIYNLVNQRKIPHSKRGHKLIFNEDELKKWVEEGKRRTHEELQASI